MLSGDEKKRLRFCLNSCDTYEKLRELCYHIVSMLEESMQEHGGCTNYEVLVLLDCGWRAFYQGTRGECIAYMEAIKLFGKCQQEVRIGVGDCFCYPEEYFLEPIPGRGEHERSKRQTA